MRYLLDTNVISALRLPAREPLVAQWAESIPVSDLFTASLVIGEIGLGVSAMERKDPAAGAKLRKWFTRSVLTGFGDRILPFDKTAALVLTGLLIPAQAPYDDALIAAVAKVHGLTVATRNTRHFQPLDVMTVNPWDPAATG
ncbi:MAG: type II toxin-antitoxin system VapC family toxin [Micrococcales bacterium]|nr:type II toxin-antitoxin system VapC family toxin [Micrococcales bacterium]